MADLDGLVEDLRGTSSRQQQALEETEADLREKVGGWHALVRVRVRVPTRAYRCLCCVCLSCYFGDALHTAGGHAAVRRGGGGAVEGALPGLGAEISA